MTELPAITICSFSERQILNMLSVMTYIDRPLIYNLRNLAITSQGDVIIEYIRDGILKCDSIPR